MLSQAAALKHNVSHGMAAILSFPLVARPEDRGLSPE
jgi:hypothetical protein